MNISEINIIIPIATAVITMGSAFLTVQKITRNLKIDKDEQEKKILEKAQDHIALEKIKLEAKIEFLQKELKNLEINVIKDMEHIRETYNGEIKNLGEKIENLRSQLQQQHSQLLTFLTKMIDK